MSKAIGQNTLGGVEHNTGGWEVTYCEPSLTQETIVTEIFLLADNPPFQMTAKLNEIAESRRLDTSLTSLLAEMSHFPFFLLQSLKTNTDVKVNASIVVLLLHSEDRKPAHSVVGEGTAKLVTEQDGQNTPNQQSSKKNSPGV